MTVSPTSIGTSVGKHWDEHCSGDWGVLRSGFVRLGLGLGLRALQPRGPGACELASYASSAALPGRPARPARPAQPRPAQPSPATASPRRASHGQPTPEPWQSSPATGSPAQPQGTGHAESGGVKTAKTSIWAPDVCYLPTEPYSGRCKINARRVFAAK